MAVIVGVATEDARAYFPQFFGRLLGISDGATVVATPAWNPLIRFFRIGEGGWVDPGGGAVPRTPDPTLRRESAPLIQDIDAIVDPTRPLIDQRYPADSLFYFDKNLDDGDFSFTAPSTLEVTCLLDFGEANDDGFGNDPEFYEIALFCDHPVEAGEYLMITYATMPKQIKNSGVQLMNVIKITF